MPHPRPPNQPSKKPPSRRKVKSRTDTDCSLNRSPFYRETRNSNIGMISLPLKINKWTINNNVIPVIIPSVNRTAAATATTTINEANIPIDDRYLKKCRINQPKQDELSCASYSICFSTHFYFVHIQRTNVIALRNKLILYIDLFYDVPVFCLCTFNLVFLFISIECRDVVCFQNTLSALKIRRTAAVVVGVLLNRNRTFQRAERGSTGTIHRSVGNHVRTTTTRRRQ